MAFCILINGKTCTLKPEQALAVWDVLQGHSEPSNDKQRTFCDNVRRLYLNRNTAPQDYLDAYPSVPESYAGTLGIRR